MLSISDYSFVLPKHLIAQEPSKIRSECKLLSFDGKNIVDYIFKDLVDILDSNTLLVFNDTAVKNARYLFSYNDSISEIFFIKNLGDNFFEVFLRKSSKFKISETYNTGDFEFTVISKNNSTSVIMILTKNIDEILDQKGLVPLPPYIKVEDPNEFKKMYQTVYAKSGHSVAAPTAGLHFDNLLLELLLKKGIEFAFINLTVGLGTFAPLLEENITNKSLHSEDYNVSYENAEVLNNALKSGKKIVSVGTTTLRCLQSCFNFTTNEFEAGTNSTNIFLYPPFDNFVVDGLITNFHLPESSLFMLICAFIGTENAKRVYQHAIDNEYKFYSFGDACFFTR